MNLDFIENLPRSQKILVMFLPVILIVALFVYSIYIPKKDAVDAVTSSINEINRQINNDEVKLRRLEQLKMENQQLQLELARLQAQLPAEQEVSGLLKQISDLSVESGLEIKLWRPAGRKNDQVGLYIEIPVDVEVAGGYHSLATFFDRVGKLPRIVNITNLGMEGTKVVNGSFYIQNKFIATTFAAVSESAEPTKNTQSKSIQK